MDQIAFLDLVWRVQQSGDQYMYLQSTIRESENSVAAALDVTASDCDCSLLRITIRVTDQGLDIVT